MITIFFNFEPTCSLRGYPGAVRPVLPVPVHGQVFMCWVLLFSTPTTLHLNSRFASRVHGTDQCGLYAG